MGSNNTAGRGRAGLGALLCAVACALVLAACGAALPSGGVSQSPAITPTSAVRVSGVSVTAAPVTFDGICSPTITVTFTAAITVAYSSTGGAVTYTWVRSDGSTGAAHTVTFPAGVSSRSVTDVWSLSANVGRFSGWESLAITGSGGIASSHAAFSFACRFKALAATIGVTPSSYDCTASAEAFTFTSTVTLSPGAGGTITYAWLRSDGTLSAPSTATAAPGAVSLTLTDTWMLPRPKAAPWEQLAITSPNAFSSAQGVIAFHC